MVPAKSQKAQLILAVPEDAGPHRSRRLSDEVDAGQLVRIRRGVYLDAMAWVRSPPWDRSLIAAAAQALAAPGTIFCRETSLALHGVSLLHTQDTVIFRAASNASVGRQAPRPMTGGASKRRLDELCRTSGGRSLSPERVFRNIRARRVQFPQAYRTELRKGLDPSSAQPYLGALADVALPELQYVSTPELLLRTEPLRLATLDTVHRFEFPSAVSVLDALRGGRHRDGTGLCEEDLSTWAEILPSQRARVRTRRAWEFSDARAENPGESWSRVLMDQLGFEAPDLQRRLILPDGSVAYVDFIWESAGVVGEFDGDQKYLGAARYGMSPEQAVLQEKKREDAIRRLGHEVVRWDWPALRKPQQLELLLREKGVPRRRR